LGRGEASTRRRGALLEDARLLSLQVEWLLLEDRLEHDGDEDRIDADDAGEAVSVGQYSA
jgi:hypothetical protein